MAQLRAHDVHRPRRHRMGNSSVSGSECNPLSPAFLLPFSFSPQSPPMIPSQRLKPPPLPLPLQLLLLLSVLLPFRPSIGQAVAAAAAAAAGAVGGPQLVAAFNYPESTVGPYSWRYFTADTPAGTSEMHMAFTVRWKEDSSTTDANGTLQAPLVCFSVGAPSLPPYPVWAYNDLASAAKAAAHRQPLLLDALWSPHPNPRLPPYPSFNATANSSSSSSSSSSRSEEAEGCCAYLTGNTTVVVRAFMDGKSEGERDVEGEGHSMGRGNQHAVQDLGGEWYVGVFSVPGPSRSQSQMISRGIVYVFDLAVHAYACLAATAPLGSLCSWPSTTSPMAATPLELLGPANVAEESQQEGGVHESEATAAGAAGDSNREGAPPTPPWHILQSQCARSSGASDGGGMGRSESSSGLNRGRFQGPRRAVYSLRVSSPVAWLEALVQPDLPAHAAMSQGSSAAASPPPLRLAFRYGGKLPAPYRPAQTFSSEERNGSRSGDSSRVRAVVEAPEEGLWLLVVEAAEEEESTREGKWEGSRRAGDGAGSAWEDGDADAVCFSLMWRAAVCASGWAGDRCQWPVGLLERLLSPWPSESLVDSNFLPSIDPLALTLASADDNSSAVTNAVTSSCSSAYCDPWFSPMVQEGNSSGGNSSRSPSSNAAAAAPAPAETDTPQALPIGVAHWAAAAAPAPRPASLGLKVDEQDHEHEYMPAISNWTTSVMAWKYFALDLPREASGAVLTVTARISPPASPATAVDAATTLRTSASEAAAAAATLAGCRVVARARGVPVAGLMDAASAWWSAAEDQSMGSLSRDSTVAVDIQHPSSGRWYIGVQLNLSLPPSLPANSTPSSSSTAAAPMPQDAALARAVTEGEEEDEGIAGAALAVTLAHMKLRVALHGCPRACNDHGSCHVLWEASSHLVPISYCYCDRTHGGTNCSVELVSETKQSMHVVALVASNAAALLPSLWAYQHKAWTEWFIYSLNGVLSALYHSCDAGSWCASNYSTLQFADFLLSFLSVLVTFIYAANLPPKLKLVAVVSSTVVIAIAARDNTTSGWQLVVVAAFGVCGLLLGWLVEWMRVRRSKALHDRIQQDRVFGLGSATLAESSALCSDGPSSGSSLSHAHARAHSHSHSHLHLHSHFACDVETAQPAAWCRLVLWAQARVGQVSMFAARIGSRFHKRYLAASVAVLLAAKLNWFYETASTYWIWHSLFHVSIFTSAYLFLCSVGPAEGDINIQGWGYARVGPTPRWSDDGMSSEGVHAPMVTGDDARSVELGVQVDPEI